MRCDSGFRDRGQNVFHSCCEFLSLLAWHALEWPVPEHADIQIMAMKNPRFTVFAGAIGALSAMTVLSAALGWAAPNLVSERGRAVQAEAYMPCTPACMQAH